MSDGLKPCPFCGGEAKMHAAFAHGAASRVGVYVECGSCGAWSKTHWGDGAQEKTAEAWNRRAECTCHAVPMDSAGNPPYRTSDVIFNLMDEGCSDCGRPWRTGYFGIPNYCPNCGAKVVDE